MGGWDQAKKILQRKTRRPTWKKNHKEKKILTHGEKGPHEKRKASHTEERKPPVRRKGPPP